MVGARGGSKRPNGSCFGGTKKAVGKRAGCATRTLPATFVFSCSVGLFFSFVLFFYSINHPLCEVYNYVQHAIYFKTTRGCYRHCSPFASLSTMQAPRWSLTCTR